MKTNCLRKPFLGFAAMCAAVTMVSCQDTKPTPEPEPVLENQIELNGGNWIDIMSAINETSGDEYTFYLSPVEDITTAVGMYGSTEPFICLTVSSVDGTIDTSADSFSVSYGDFTASSENLSAISSASISVTFDDATSSLTVTLDITLSDGSTLKADFEGTCPAAGTVELTDQYEFDHVIYSIGSAVAERNMREGTTTWYLYETAGITEVSEAVAADIVISLSHDLLTDGSASVDLATAIGASLDGPDGFTSAQGAATGTLTLSETVVSGHPVLSVTIDAESAGTSLRAAFNNDYVITYDAINSFSVSRPTTLDGAPTVTTYGLSKIFLAASDAQDIFMLGSNGQASAPADLMTGEAVKITVAASGMQDISSCAFALYNYEYYTTADQNSAEYRSVEGEIYTDEIGDNTYLYFNVNFVSQNNENIVLNVSGDWYGPTTAAEDTDLTPVIPVTPKISIVNPTSGETVYEAEIERVEMRMQSSYRFQGNNITNCYFFYFVPANAEISSIDSDRINVPLLMLPESVMTGEDVNIGDSTKGIFWQLNYQRSGLYNSQYYYGGPYSMICPSTTTVNVIKNADKTWHISFSMTDSYTNWGQQTGSQNQFSIVWEGPLTKYSGSNTNEYTDY